MEEMYNNKEECHQNWGGESGDGREREKIHINDDDDDVKEVEGEEENDGQRRVGEGRGGEEQM